MGPTGDGGPGKARGLELRAEVLSRGCPGRKAPHAITCQQAWALRETKEIMPEPLVIKSRPPNPY